MSVSIVAIAQESGVSKSTVSRVLNEHPQVSPEAVKVVREAIRKLGYTKPKGRIGRPRRNPQGIRVGTICALFPSVRPGSRCDTISARVLQGAEEVLRPKRLNLLVSTLAENEKPSLSIEQRHVDGVLFRGTSATPAESLLEILGKLPCVCLFESGGPFPDRWDAVVEDTTAIAKIARDYLLGRGCKNLGYINPSPEHRSMKLRGRAFRDLAEEAGVNVTMLNKGERVDDVIAEALQAGVDGIFVGGFDDAVIDLYRALRAQGRMPCGEIPFISCSLDTRRMETLDPELPTIDLQLQAIGRAGADLLLWRLQNPQEPQRRVLVSPILHLAGSSSAVPAAAPESDAVLM